MIRRRMLQVAGALVVVAAGGVAAVAAFAGSDAGAAGDTASGLPPSTAEVTRQTLDDTTTENGSLGFGDPSTVANRLPGTLTSVAASGGTVARGQPLYEVDDLPVVLMHGTLPAYRPLTDGTEGPDVRQLEENLAALGYTGFTVDEEYTSATADAVTRWQEDLGLPETGAVELGRVVFTAGDVRVDTVDAEPGQPLSPGAKVLTHTGVAKAVTVELAPTDQRLAVVGAAVGVTLPDGTELAGTIAEAATVIEPGGQGEDPTTTVRVLVGLADQQAAAAYAMASVDVTFTAERRENVLTVPVAALLALAEGGFGVEVVEGGRSRYVPVETGLFAGGRVEVSGTGIAEGVRVGMPE